MAFNIILLSQFLPKQEYNWHIQNRKPSIINADIISVRLLADGDELDMIRARFENIPITKGNICVWSGEMAKFIYNNL